MLHGEVRVPVGLELPGDGARGSRDETEAEAEASSTNSVRNKPWRAFPSHPDRVVVPESGSP